jgi:hypothetical protein
VPVAPPELYVHYAGVLLPLSLTDILVGTCCKSAHSSRYLESKSLLPSQLTTFDLTQKPNIEQSREVCNETVTDAVQKAFELENQISIGMWLEPCFFVLRG